MSKVFSTACCVLQPIHFGFFWLFDVYWMFPASQILIMFWDKLIWCPHDIWNANMMTGKQWRRTQIQKISDKVFDRVKNETGRDSLTFEDLYIAVLLVYKYGFIYLSINSLQSKPIYLFAPLPSPAKNIYSYIMC